MAALALFGGFGGFQPGIAHFAHLGGFLGGFLYLRWLARASDKGEFQKQSAVSPIRDEDLQRWAKIPRETMHEVNREEFDRIMAKINSPGAASLTHDEIAFLERFSPE